MSRTRRQKAGPSHRALAGHRQRVPPHSFPHYAAVHGAGTVVNPKTLNGRVIGGTISGSPALYEEYLYDDEGRVRNENFEYYHLPSSMDVSTNDG